MGLGEIEADARLPRATSRASRSGSAANRSRERRSVGAASRRGPGVVRSCARLSRDAGRCIAPVFSCRQLCRYADALDRGLPAAPKRNSAMANRGAPPATSRAPSRQPRPRRARRARAGRAARGRKPKKRRAGGRRSASSSISSSARCCSAPSWSRRSASPRARCCRNLMIGDYLFVVEMVLRLFALFAAVRHPSASRAASSAACPSAATSSSSAIRAADEDYVKRVIGLPGDTIEVRDGVVILNGQAAAAPADRRFRPAGQPEQPLPRPRHDAGAAR